MQRPQSPRATLTTFVHEAFSHKVSLLCTDQWNGYKGLGKEYPHNILLVRPTQAIEGFWSLIKRSSVGIFHGVIRKYLHLYLAEFQFRHNNRHNADNFGTAIVGC